MTSSKLATLTLAAALALTGCTAGSSAGTSGAGAPTSVAASDGTKPGTAVALSTMPAGVVGGGKMWLPNAFKTVTFGRAPSANGVDAPKNGTWLAVDASFVGETKAEVAVTNGAQRTVLDLSGGKLWAVAVADDASGATLDVTLDGVTQTMNVDGKVDPGKASAVYNIDAKALSMRGVDFKGSYGPPRDHKTIEGTSVLAPGQTGWTHSTNGQLVYQATAYNKKRGWAPDGQLYIEFNGVRFTDVVTYFLPPSSGNRMRYCDYKRTIKWELKINGVNVPDQDYTGEGRDFSGATLVPTSTVEALLKSGSTTGVHSVVEAYSPTPDSSTSTGCPATGQFEYEAMGK